MGNTDIICYHSFDALWAAMLQERENYPDDTAYQALTEEIAHAIWNHAIISREARKEND